jgi:phosphatidylglycerophosphate synthase
MSDALEDKIRQAMNQAVEAEEVAADPTPEKVEGRRPIASRNSNVAKWAAQSLVHSGVTPNQISIASMGFAAIAFLLLWGAGYVANTPGRGLMLLVAAICVQGRLICNLLDGMVAVEGGKAEADGPFWNEFPDRVADILILGGLGLAVAHPGLGFLAAALAVCTAYVRELGRANGAESDFSGPMAKQHRMAVVTGALVLAAFWPIWASGADVVLLVALWGIVLGTAGTIARRGWTLIEWLRARQ